MTQAEALYRLQQIDLQMLRAKKRLNEIALALQDSAALQQAQREADAADKRLSPLKARTRNLELEIQSTAEKAQTTEEHLYSGRVKNPKEMQELQQEIDALKRRRRELEDQLLETMMAVEEAEADLSEKQSALRSAQSDWENQNRALLDEQTRLNEQITSAQAQRKTAAQDVTPQNLKVYETMKPKKGNQPIALMQGRTCSVCGVEQTLIIETEVRRGQTLATCLNCERILVALK